MDFMAFINSGWDRHGADSAAVAETLSQGLDLIGKPGDVAPYCGLAIHVLGEHLGRWDEALALLDQVEGLSHCEAGSEAAGAVLRSKSVMCLAKGDEDGAETFAAKAHTGPFPLSSTRIRVLAIAAAALLGQGDTARAATLFEEAMGLADDHLESNDPAVRSLAVTGNNLACDLEEQTDRSEAATNLMVRAAKAGRTYWEIAGTWQEVERAEYRLAMTFLEARRPAEGLEHARLCLKGCEDNRAGLFEFFFAHEAMARCFHAMDKKEDAESARDKAAQCIATMKNSVEYMGEQLSILDKVLGR